MTHHAKMAGSVHHQEYVPVQEAGVVNSVNKVCDVYIIYCDQFCQVLHLLTCTLHVYSYVLAQMSERRYLYRSTTMQLHRRVARTPL